MNGGIFVCTYEGLYHFSANIYADGGEEGNSIGLHILVNGKNVAYNKR